MSEPAYPQGGIIGKMKEVLRKVEDGGEGKEGTSGEPSLSVQEESRKEQGEKEEDDFLEEMDEKETKEYLERKKREKIEETYERLMTELPFLDMLPEKERREIARWIVENQPPKEITDYEEPFDSKQIEDAMDTEDEIIFLDPPIPLTMDDTVDIPGTAYEPPGKGENVPGGETGDLDRWEEEINQGWDDILREEEIRRNSELSDSIGGR